MGDREAKKEIMFKTEDDIITSYRAKGGSISKGRELRKHLKQVTEEYFFKNYHHDDAELTKFDIARLQAVLTNASIYFLKKKQVISFYSAGSLIKQFFTITPRATTQMINDGLIEQIKNKLPKSVLDSTECCYEIFIAYNNNNEVTMIGIPRIPNLVIGIVNLFEGLNIKLLPNESNMEPNEYIEFTVPLGPKTIIDELHQKASVNFETDESKFPPVYR